MKYYNKYKDADEYTYIKKVPDEYRDFIPVAKQIQDSDKIIIRNPFYIYFPGDDAEICENFYFFAERNGKKLCMFCIDIGWETEEISLSYDKMEDSQFRYDRETIGETLFYNMDGITYAETPDHIKMVRDRQISGGEKMASADGVDWEAEQKAIDQKFKKKSYDEKKDEILDYLAKMKTGENQKGAEKNRKNLKLDLEDEYAEPDKDTKERGRTGIYIVIGIGVLVIAAFAGGIILVKKRKRE